MKLELPGVAVGPQRVKGCSFVYVCSERARVPDMCGQMSQGTMGVPTGTWTHDLGSDLAVYSPKTILLPELSVWMLDP